MFPASHIIHIACVFALLGLTFYAAGAPLESRRTVMILSGIAALLVLGSGLDMLMRMHLAFRGWVVVKLVCWLGISAFAGVAYRRREKAVLWICLSLGLAIVATAMAYLKPF